MKKDCLLLIICILFFSSCVFQNQQESNHYDYRKMYMDYLDEYWCSDPSKIDSALKYNSYVLESDTADFLDYYYRINMLYYCGRYDSILSFVDRIPQDIFTWPPEYNMYLRLKCKAIMARESYDRFQYERYLDSILILWTPIMEDSISKADSLFSMPFDSLDAYGNLWYWYVEYCDIFYHRHGMDSLYRILDKKKETYKWDDTTDMYFRLSLGVTSGGEHHPDDWTSGILLTLP